jgi:hypothetical protein
MKVKGASRLCHFMQEIENGSRSTTNAADLAELFDGYLQSQDFSGQDDRSDRGLTFVVHGQQRG